MGLPLVYAKFHRQDATLIKSCKNGLVVLATEVTPT